MKVDKCDNVYENPNSQSSQGSESKGQAVKDSHPGNIYVNPNCSLTDNEDPVLSCIEQDSYSSSFKSEYAQF